MTCLVTLFDCKLQIFKNSPKLTIFGIFNELMSTENVNVARFARNVEWDFFCDFQILCILQTFLLTTVGSMSFYFDINNFGPKMQVTVTTMLVVATISNSIRNVRAFILQKEFYKTQLFFRIYPKPRITKWSIGGYFIPWIFWQFRWAFTPMLPIFLPKGNLCPSGQQNVSSAKSRVAWLHAKRKMTKWFRF